MAFLYSSYVVIIAILSSTMGKVIGKSIGPATWVCRR